MTEENYVNDVVEELKREEEEEFKGNIERVNKKIVIIFHDSDCNELYQEEFETEEQLESFVERCIRNIANLQKRKLDVDKQLSEAKEEFKTLKMQATNFADLLS